MSKIDEFEQRIIIKGMTDEDFSEYEKLLKRVRDNFSKRQHCYTTAVQMPYEYSDQAIKLIQYGLDNFEDGWFSTYTSYLYMGRVYERTGEYKKAYDSYLSAKDALGMEHPKYVEELSKELLWMKLHIDSFSYSVELEEYLSCYQKSDDFSKAFVNNQFRMTVAGIVIALHYRKTDEAKRLLEIARKLCSPDYRGELHNLLAGHRCYESINVTKEAIDFIESIEL